MNASCRLCATFQALTARPSTTAGLARSAAGSPLALAAQNTNRSCQRAASASPVGAHASPGDGLRVDAHLLQFGVAAVPAGAAVG
ncbi:hypothetical protein AB0J72_22910 [Dactylosporangium sp. NPDC049742]|uniref:hypothetical protein n=1 Tax=Dactylosporangium sp. NPDC049742 TaxID=3154737 RepID=UPI003439D55C